MMIFAGFPRLNTGLFSSGPPSPVSGFSEAVRLGDVGKIKKNSSVVMRIEFTRNGKPHRPKDPVYWRGVVLDHFNGSSWFSTARPKWKFSNQPGVGTKLFPFDPVPRLIRQDIYMDGFDSNVIFTQGVPLFVDGDFRHLQINMNFALKTLDRNSHPKTVTLISDPASSFQSHFQDKFDMKSGRRRKKFLQLPALSSEIVQLAERLTQNTAEASADRILNHLRTNFDYTLELETGPGQTTLDHFLFTRKKGHCEYFASSMIVLLRLNGIPARLVNGFMGVEWNDLGHYMVVRQKHAHSWVEAYFPDKGWVVYDPTPCDPAFAQSDLNDPMSRVLDLLQWNWQRYIVRYSLHRQTFFLAHLKSTGEETLKSIQRLGTLDREEMNALIIDNLKIALISIALGIALILAWRNYPRWRFVNSSRHPFPAWLYQEMLKKLQATGIHKPPHWTHREFLQRLPILPQNTREIIQKITEAYEKCRFGQASLLKAEKKELLNHLRKI